tara:strand:+ start:1738 stop:2661 length:924 start_codon:yes stop_codon:yes gene_type:complete
MSDLFRKYTVKDITVCVCTYNRWKSLPQTLRSIKYQSSGIPNLILVDDASSNNIPLDIQNLINSFKNSVYIKHSSNKGLAAARNTGINNTKTRLFTFIDDDDQWEPDYLKNVLEAYNKNRNIDMLIGIKPTRFKILENRFNSSISIQTLFAKGFCPPVGSQVYKTKLLKQISGYNENVKSGVDLDLWVRLLCINCNSTIIWGDWIKVGMDQRVRITTNEFNRIKKSKASLTIWETYIVREMGRRFFNNYSRAYINHLYAGFVLQYIKSFKFSKIRYKHTRIPIFVDIIQKLFFHKLLGFNGSPTLFL